MPQIQRLRRWAPPAALALSLCFVFYCRLKSPDLTWFNTHMSRDFTRALDLLHGQPSSFFGPEMNYHAGRLLGPAFYFIVAGLWFVTQSLPGLLTALHLVGILLALVVCWNLRKDCGKATAVVFFLLFLLNPVVAYVSRTLWNPALLVPLNLLYLIFIRRYCEKPSDSKWLVSFFLVGWIGLQIHLSSIVGLVASSIVIYWQTKAWRKLLLGWAALTVYVLGALAYQGSLSSFATGIETQYSFPQTTAFYLHAFFRRWAFHLHLDRAPLNDYELFPLLFHLGRKLFPTTFYYMTWFAKAWLVHGVIWLTCLSYVSWRYFTKRINPKLVFYVRLTLVWGIVATLPMLFYTIRGGAFPYRYGLPLYPIQFFPLALAFALLLEEPRRLARALAWPILAFATGIFVGNAVFLLKSYDVIESSGRVSHQYFDAMEIPLRYKMTLLKFGLANSGGVDPYPYLHGAEINKIRQKEFDWNHTVHYGGIARSLEKTAVSRPKKTHYFIDSFSLDEMRANADSSARQLPFHYEKLSANDLPKRVRVEAFSKDGEKSYTLEFPEGAMILPLDFDWKAKPSSIRVTFDIMRTSKRFLRVGYDSSPGRHTLRLRDFLVDKKPVEYVESRNGRFEHRIAVSPLLSSKGVRVELRFDVKAADNRFSRVDIFASSTSHLRYY